MLCRQALGRPWAARVTIPSPGSQVRITASLDGQTRQKHRPESASGGSWSCDPRLTRAARYAPGGFPRALGYPHRSRHPSPPRSDPLGPHPRSTAWLPSRRAWPAVQTARASVCGQHDRSALPCQRSGASTRVGRGRLPRLLERSQRPADLGNTTPRYPRPGATTRAGASRQCRQRGRRKRPQSAATGARGTVATLCRCSTMRPRPALRSWHDQCDSRRGNPARGPDDCTYPERR